MFKSFSALVIHRDPAYDVEDISFWRSDHVVIGIPIHAAGYVTELTRCLSCFVGAQNPIEGGLHDGVISEGREEGFARQSEA